MGTSVRTAELCRNAHISTGTQPPLLQVPRLPQLFSKWNTSASSPRPSSSFPPLSWPCPTRKWRSQVASEGLLLLLQHQVLGGFGPFIPAVNANSNQGLANTGAGLGLGAVGAIAAGNCLFGQNCDLSF